MAKNSNDANSHPRRDMPLSQHEFLWGVSTSSYQIEGAANEDGRGPSIWDTFCRQKGRIAHGETGDTACDHYHRYAEDIALIRDLGVQAYRFSVSWPRVLPHGRGDANEPGLAFYDRLIDGLLTAGIEPWLCLYHWDLPQSLEDAGGWTNRDCAGWFAEYAALIAHRYGDRVKRFATFNEPSLLTLFGYGFGWHAPGICARAAYLRAIHHVNLAHGAAVDVLRAVPATSIGGIHNWQPCHPATPSDTAAAEQLAAFWDCAMADPQHLGRYPSLLAEMMEPNIQAGDLARICRPVDWFGLNHYSPIYVKSDPTSPLGFALAPAPPGLPLTGVAWPIVPDAFCDTLLSVHQRYRLPIYVLENGFGSLHDRPNATGKIIDQDRIEFLTRYTDAMRAAMDAGADVRGYFVWSLLDNFEWNSGYGSRFGLVYVDYSTYRRTPKASFYWYARMIKDAPERHTPQSPIVG
jgi:beta-glucosidase